jgi:hypothetical protein
MIIVDVVVAILIVQILAAIVLRVAIMFRRNEKKAEPIYLQEAPVQDGRYDWSSERSELRGKTPREQRKILARWIDATVESMHCSEKDAERFFRINLADALR